MTRTQPGTHMLALSIAFKATLSVGLYLCVVGCMETTHADGGKSGYPSDLALKSERRHLYAVTCLALAAIQVTFLPARSVSPNLVVGIVILNAAAYLTLSLFAVWSLMRRAHDPSYPWLVALGVLGVVVTTFRVLLPEPVVAPPGVVYAVAAVTVTLVAAILWMSASEARVGRA